ncbi:hypothetical protein DPMN_037114 [Dreissena polymorpha]|uniref:Uncharacterized protein n=1 Tax=Dreissena polymorpha TaxID=45954 RepID=A0A9D4MCV7_DREPO|nr:hypothetical protein DPMN_037114 [Dreissena polymorpha]
MYKCKHCNPPNSTLSETKRRRLEGNFNGDSDNENTTTDFKSVDSIIRHIDTSCQTDVYKGHIHFKWRDTWHYFRLKIPI